MKNRILIASCLGVLICVAAAWFYIDQRIRSGVDQRLQAAVDDGRYEALYYEKLGYNLKGEIWLRNLHVEQPGIHYMLELVRLSNLDFRNDPPRTIAVTVEGLRFPSGVPAIDSSSTLGYLLSHVASTDNIPLQLHYSHRIDPDRDWQIDSTVNIDIPGLMQLDLAGTVRNLPLDSLQEPVLDPFTQQPDYLSMLNGTEFPALDIRLQDGGLVQAMLEAGAADYNVAPEDYQSLISSQLRNAWLFMPQQTQELMMEAGGQLADFLEGGRTLVVSMRPEHKGSMEVLQPLIFGAVFSGNFNQVVELLNLELSTL